MRGKGELGPWVTHPNPSLKGGAQSPFPKGKGYRDGSSKVEGARRTMPQKGIPSGRLVSPEFFARAKELRQNVAPVEGLLW